MPDKLTNVGTRVYASASLPATYDVTGYAALTWTAVPKIASIPEKGPSASVVSQSYLSDGVVRKGHGEVNYGGGQMQFGPANGDAGQAILKAAFHSTNSISLKIVRSTGLIEYDEVIVTGYVTTESTNSSVHAGMFSIEITEPTVYDDAGV